MTPPIQRRQVFPTILAGRGGGDEAEAMITTATLDLQNDRVFPEGVDLEQYKKNPIVLYGHQWAGGESGGLPVGGATKLDVSPSGIRAKWRWLENDPFAARVKNAWDQGILRGVSIGFIPTEYHPNEAGGYNITRSRLLEFSITAIPANPDAVRQLKRLGLDDKSVETAKVRQAIRQAFEAGWQHAERQAVSRSSGGAIYLSPEECRALLRHVRLRQAIAQHRRDQLLSQFPFLAGPCQVDHDREVSHARGFGEFYE